MEFTFLSNSSTLSLQACLRKPGAREGLVALLTPRSHALLGALQAGGGTEAQRVDLLARARSAGVC
jgi:hypothetical protein